MRKRFLLQILLLSLTLCFLWYIVPYSADFPAPQFLRVMFKMPTIPPIPTIFVITPTYTRLVQKAELTRIANTFRQVPALHWIVVEDALQKTQLVMNFLQSSQIPHTHLCIKSNKTIIHSRGTLQRNLGLSWLRKTFDPKNDPAGVVYFADDDNTYSLEIFKEMRYTKKVSVWPVGLAGGVAYESVKVNKKGNVVGWMVGYDPSRPFAIDMAGFAINLKLILEKRKAKFHLDARPGYQEPSLLQDLVTMEELEPKAANCTKILVWHTRTELPTIEFNITYMDKNVEV